MTMLSIALLSVPFRIVVEGGLSFLGLSIPPPTPTWGNMIVMGRSDLLTAPWTWGFPAAALFLTVLAFNFVGDAIRQRLDARDSTL